MTWTGGTSRMGFNEEQRRMCERFPQNNLADSVATTKVPSKHKYPEESPLWVAETQTSPEFSVSWFPKRLCWPWWVLGAFEHGPWAPAAAWPRSPGLWLADACLTSHLQGRKEGLPPPRTCSSTPISRWWKGLIITVLKFKESIRSGTVKS